MKKIASLIAVIQPLLASALCAAPNLIVTTDIGGDPDDIQAMRRLMLYANDFNILGLIASAAGTPNNNLPPQTRTDLINAAINDYGTVRNNLALHASGYPTTAYLLGVVKSGNPNRGTNYVGAAHDTAGSNWIISQVDAAAGPVAITIWGGATDVAQAFYRVRADRTDAQEAAWVSKVRIYSIHDQDGLNSSTGDKPSTLAWIRTNFPNVWMIEPGSLTLMNSGQLALFRGMYQNDSAGGGAPTIQLVQTADVSLNQQAWMDANVRTGHGALGAGYPNVTQNPQTTRNTVGDKSGDTPSWFYFLPNGLSDPAQPGWGNWGGRFNLSSGQFYVDAEDAHWSGNANVPLRRKWTVARWRRSYQHELAARMDWCVKTFAQANHAPVAHLNGDATKNVVNLTAAPSSVVNLSAAGSSDPDGNALSYKWWQYAEADTYAGTVTINNSTASSANFTLPADSNGKTVHIILEVTDNGSPALTSYRRLVVTAASGTVPSAPSGLTATAASASQVNLAWNDNSSNETQFRIERKIGSGTYSFLVNKSANATTHSDTGLSASTTYTYRVRAENANGNSAFSNEASATTQSGGSGLISNLSVASGKAYVVVPNLQNGELVYIDRTFTYTNVGSYAGLTFIRTANDDKNRTETSFLSFNASQAVTVYVAYDVRATSLPNWLSSWTNTGDLIGTTDVDRRIYSKQFSAGTVTLGANAATGMVGAGSMYSVIVAASSGGDIVNGLAGQWKLNETSGTTASDSSGNNLNGTLVNGPVWSSGTLVFDGVNDYVNLGNPTQLQFTGAMTLSAWVKVTSFTNGRIIAKQGGSTNRGWTLNVESGGFASFQIADSANTVHLVNSSTLATNTWYHVVGVYEPGTAIRLYVNAGTPVSKTTSIPASQRNSTLNVNMGRRPDNASGTYLNGALNDVRAYNRVLSASEITTLFNNGAQ